MGFVFMAIRSRPWIISVPVIAVLGAALLAALAVFDKSSFNTLISGDGYFIKTREVQAYVSCRQKDNLRLCCSA